MGRRERVHLGRMPQVYNLFDNVITVSCEMVSETLVLPLSNSVDVSKHLPLPQIQPTSYAPPDAPPYTPPTNQLAVSNPPTAAHNSQKVRSKGTHAAPQNNRNRIESAPHPVARAKFRNRHDCTQVRVVQSSQRLSQEETTSILLTVSRCPEFLMPVADPVSRLEPFEGHRELCINQQGRPSRAVLDLISRRVGSGEGEMCLKSGAPNFSSAVPSGARRGRVSTCPTRG